MTVGYQQQKAMVLADRSTSFWLKDSIITLEGRDPCDAIGDLEALLQLARARLDDNTADLRSFDADRPTRRSV